jgi:hypothetical protein
MTIDIEDIVRYLHMRNAEPDPALTERMLALRRQAAAAIRPACAWRRFTLTEGGVISGGQALQIAGTLAAHLKGCREVYLVCGTLGVEFDAFLRKVSATSGADALIVQAIGTAAIEQLMNSAENRLRAELSDGETLTSRYSPGYGDFPLSEQRTILTLLDAARKAGISLSDTLLMVPSKSVSAVIGVRSTQ